jgi:hypothetical protein
MSGKDFLLCRHDCLGGSRLQDLWVGSVLFDPYAGQMKYLADFLASSDDVPPGR